MDNYQFTFELVIRPASETGDYDDEEKEEEEEEEFDPRPEISTSFREEKILVKICEYFSLLCSASFC